jgi:hypothetical protein
MGAGSVVRRLVFVGPNLEDLRGFPENVKGEIGFALVGTKR